MKFVDQNSPINIVACDPAHGVCVCVFGSSRGRWIMDQVTQVSLINTELLKMRLRISSRFGLV